LKKIKKDMAEKKEMSEEEILKNHLDEVENNNKLSPLQSKAFVDNTRVDDLSFFNIDVKELPCGKFYPRGTLVMVRPAKTKEIQSYSMVDDNNFYDVIEKMNDILRSCVRVKYSNGEIGSYLDIKDQDRIFLILMIRELTFQKGNILAVSSTCADCNTDNQIELIRKNFRFHEFDEKLMKYYNQSTNSFIFKTKNGKEFEISPPNIGLQRSFTEYIIKENNDKKAPNLSFLKIIPFMMRGKNSVKYEEIKKSLEEFEKIEDMSFQFLNQAVSKMTFGIKQLSHNCTSCGVEIRTDMQFPNGSSGIFVIHDAFEAFIEE
jgi:hypothetical protein